MCAVGDAVVVVAHVVGVHFVGEVGILVANELIPSIIRMEGVGVVPRVVHHLGTAVIVGTHHKSVFFGKLHKPFCFSLVGIAIGVWTTIGVGIVAVHINTVGVVTGGTVHVVIACVISSVRVGVRANIKVNIVHNGLNFRLVRVFKQIVNQAKHQNPACGFVAVDGAGVEELGLTSNPITGIVKVRNQNLASRRQCAKCYDFAFVRMVGLEIKHHGFVSLVGRVAVPVVFSAVAAVPHRDFFK